MAAWNTADFLSAVPDLKGLEEDSRSKPSSSRSGVRWPESKQFHNSLPVVTAREEIGLDRLDGVGYGREDFQYTVSKRTGANEAGLDEYRTGKDGKRTEPEPLEHGLVTKGFAGLPLYLHPLRQPDSTFRYLGMQNVGGHPEDVLFFAQTGGTARPLLQGLIWIDSSSSQIVRMRLELLNPDKESGLKQEMVDAHFSPAEIKAGSQPLWLPDRAIVTLTCQGGRFRNRHQFSAYQISVPGPLSAPIPDRRQGDSLLSRFKPKMEQNLSQVPNYTCLETIERSIQDPRAKAFSAMDSILLEVSTVAGKEMLAWPGAHRFEEVDLATFVSGGLLSTGVFASHARSVFLGSAASIQYRGSEEIAGRMLERFDFVVPQASSGYQIETDAATVKVGTAGAFWVDPDLLQLVRLDVQANQVPAELGIDRTETVIDYAPMRIGTADILLPQGARTDLVLRTGEIRRNDMQFSHCHAYYAESAIRFDMPNPAAPAASEQRTVDLPPGLTVALELETPIDSQTAHVGDVLRGHVVSDVRSKGKILVPKGAVAMGRIRAIEKLPAPGQGTDLTVELVELRWENATAEFYGELIRGTDKDSFLLNLPSIDGGAFGLPDTAANLKAEGVSTRIPGTGVIRLPGAKFHIAAGLRMNWRTLDPNRHSKKSR